MKNKNVSIKDIAGALNISITTVSFVLNGKAEDNHISKKLTERVLDYAKEVNYKPNQIAQSLRSGKSKILVFMVEDISNNFFARLAKIIEKTVYDEGYKIVYCSNENQDKKSIELISLFKKGKIDGFIIVPSPGIKSIIEELIEGNIPVILLDRYFSDMECNSIVVNNQQSTYGATSHLISNNFKNIAFITTDSEQMHMQCRLLGYKNAVTENNLKAHVLKIPHNDASNLNSKDFIKNFIDCREDLDAVFFATNYFSKVGLAAIREINPKLIDNLGIVIFDDNEIFEMYTPALTAVIQPLEAIGDNIMELMFKLLRQKNAEKIVERIVLNTELKIRESSSLKINK